MSIATSSLSEAPIAAPSGSQGNPKVPPKRRVQAKPDEQLEPEPR